MACMHGICIYGEGRMKCLVEKRETVLFSSSSFSSKGNVCVCVKRLAMFKREIKMQQYK